MRISRPLLLLVPLLCLGVAVPAVHADQEAPAAPADRLQLALERVVVFKDGFSLLVERGTATADEKGRVHTFEVPDAAVLGSFWAFAKDTALVGMRADLVTDVTARTEEASCLTVLDLLRANVGRELTLRVRGPHGSNEQTDLVCTVVRVLEHAPSHTPVTQQHLHPNNIPHPAHRRGVPQPSRPAPSDIERERMPVGGQMVLVKDGDGRHIVMPVGTISTITAGELETTYERTFERTRVRKRLTLELGADKAGKAVEVVLMHFAPGIRWIPTYRVSGALEDDASLALQAELLNEVRDIEGVPMDLVVGVPHFRFRDVVSPLVLEGQLRRALRQAAPQIMGQIAGGQALSNAYFSGRAGERRNTSQGPSGLAPELAAQGAHDLFVYSVPSVDLPKGARATLPLWQSTIPLRHLYTSDIQLGRDARGGKTYVRGLGQSTRSSQSQGSPLELAEHRVWHQLELLNESDVPWTTGAAMTMRGTLPLGQDMLTYTSVGAKALLPLTVAVDVCTEYKEIELSREPNAVNWHRQAYARITKEARITLCSYRKEKSDVRLRLGLGGRVLEASDDGAIVLNDFRQEDWQNHGYAYHLNNHSDVEWNIVLGPGEKRDIVVRYEFFVR